jgi:aspartokinase-like uncharacterized kinase
MAGAISVVKVGGSLYDLPDLGARLQDWLAVERASGWEVVLVPGGGATADLVRALDRQHGLGEERSHWLALRALTFNAHFLASLLSSACVTDDPLGCGGLREQGRIPILDIHEFARADDGREGRLPHCWAATSDSFAARVAVVMGARSLVLLKSTTIPEGVDWTDASCRGWVDGMFAEVLRQATADLCVSAVNLRSWRR